MGLNQNVWNSGNRVLIAAFLGRIESDIPKDDHEYFLADLDKALETRDPSTCYAKMPKDNKPFIDVFILHLNKALERKDQQRFLSLMLDYLNGQHRDYCYAEMERMLADYNVES